LWNGWTTFLRCGKYSWNILASFYCRLDCQSWLGHHRGVISLHWRGMSKPSCFIVLSERILALLFLVNKSNIQFLSSKEHSLVDLEVVRFLKTPPFQIIVIICLLDLRLIGSCFESPICPLDLLKNCPFKVTSWPHSPTVARHWFPPFPTNQKTLNFISFLTFCLAIWNLLQINHKSDCILEPFAFQN